MNMDNQTAMYAIALIGSAYALVSTVIYQKIGSPKRIKEIQAESSRLSKEMNQAIKSKDDKRIDSINKEYEKFMPQMGEMMMLQFKPLIIVIPLIFILTPVITSVFAGFTITLPFYLPIFLQRFDMLLNLSFLGDFNTFLNWRALFGPIGWFWICVVFAGLAISIINSQLDKRNSQKKEGKKEEGTEEGGKPDKPKEKEIKPADKPKAAEPSPASEAKRLAEMANS